MVLVYSRSYLSPSYKGIYKIFGSSKYLEHDNNDTLDDWVEKNAIFSRKRKFVIFDGEVLCNIETEVVGCPTQSDSSLLDDDSAVYSRKVNLELSPSDKLPSELFFELERLKYTRED